MKIQTLSVLVGSQACNARCPFCVSKMTPNKISSKVEKPNWLNFEIACDLVRAAGATTAMLTGKGEPTLWPELITQYLSRLQGKIPLLELQTNGIRIMREEKAFEDQLRQWRDLHLATVSVSVASMDAQQNFEIYRQHFGQRSHFEIPKIVDKLHSFGFSVRLSTVMVGGFIDTVEAVADAITKANSWGVEQLTLIPVNSPQQTESEITSKWVDQHRISAWNVAEIHEYLVRNGDSLMRLPHGAEVFDVRGQNVCLNNCLKAETITEQIRNLIFHPDGHLRTDWQHKGSILL